MTRGGPIRKLATERAKGDWQPDFNWLTETLAVGGCFPIERAVDLADNHRIKAVIDLREEDCDDDRRLTEAGIRLLHLPTTDMEAATGAMLDRGVAFARGHIESGERVLIHCQHGIGRSALLALCVLVDQGFAPLDALNLAKDRRARVSPSPSQYQGWAEWLRQHRHPVPDFHTFGCIAYRHLARG